MNNRILFITICSWSLFAIGDGADNPLKQLVAIHKHMAQERLQERCVEYVRKHYPEKISAERRQGGMQSAIAGVSKGALVGLAVSGSLSLYMFLVGTLSTRGVIRVVSPVTAYGAFSYGFVQWWEHKKKIEEIVLHRELANLGRQEAVSNRAAVMVDAKP
jgi:hypothetical protein